MCEDSREALPKCRGDGHHTLPGAGRVHLEAVSVDDTSTCISMPRKAQRAGRLAEEAGLKNVKFRVMDALNMEQGTQNFQ